LKLNIYSQEKKLNIFRNYSLEVGKEIIAQERDRHTKRKKKKSIVLEFTKKL